MTRRIDTQAVIDSVRLAEQGSDPSTPASGFGSLYAKSDGLYFVDDAGIVEGPFFGKSGWINSGETWTYASADAPTFTFTIAGVDLTTKYNAGMRIKLTQSTGGTKYFIITAVAFSTDTTITIYGGTDYTLNNEAITSPFYSSAKAPAGFPLDPLKWTVRVLDTTARAQATPTQNTWYNLGAVAITIPIGSWNTSYQVMGAADRTANGVADIVTTLSTANNTESDKEFSSWNAVQATTDGTATKGIQLMSRRKFLLLTIKTIYYLNSRTTTASIGNIANRNETGTAVLEAVCGYL